MKKEIYPLNQEKSKVLLEVDVKIKEENLDDCVSDMILEMLKDIDLTYSKSDIFFARKKELLNKNNACKNVINLDELFRIFGYYYFNKHSNNSNVSRNFRKFMSRYRIRCINNYPHVRRINLTQEEIEECKSSNLSDKKIRIYIL